MEIRASAAMSRVTRQPDPRPAFLPRTGAPEVLAPRIRQENVCSAPRTLESALEPPGPDRQLRQIDGIIYGDEQVDILGIDLLSQNGAEQCDAANSGQGASLPNEDLSLSQLAAPARASHVR